MRAITFFEIQTGKGPVLVREGGSVQLNTPGTNKFTVRIMNSHDAVRFEQMVGRMDHSWESVAASTYPSYTLEEFLQKWKMLTGIVTPHHQSMSHSERSFVEELQANFETRHMWQSAALCSRVLMENPNQDEVQEVRDYIRAITASGEINKSPWPKIRTAL